MQDIFQPQPVFIKRKTILISLLLHVLVFILAITAPRIFAKKKIKFSPKFFSLVNVQTKRARKVEKPDRKPIKRRTKPKAVPSIGAKMEKRVDEAPQEEFLPPTSVKVTNASFKYDWYLEHIVSKVERYWSPPRGIPGDEDLHVVVLFIIERSGRISDVALHGSSENETLDRLGLRAIQRAAPFPRLPPRFLEGRLNVTFQLNYIR